jgi:uncharacterized YigZ family protein|tara:strand:+ start:218 stop:838 length:621 start_codon:yes stop_codon:yes gene_type:complete
VSYTSPHSSISTEFEEKRSRFISYLVPVQSRVAALEFLQALKRRYPDARHHCWAYIVGDPASAVEQAFSDDGEPSGTAGKPILNVLQHRAVGDCMAVVVRYFGGIKLGAGGLVRAYSSAASRVVDAADLVEYVAITELHLSCDYDQESLLRRLLIRECGSVLSVDYEATVVLTVSLPESRCDTLLQLMSVQGGGRMRKLNVQSLLL